MSHSPVQNQPAGAEPVSQLPPGLDALLEFDTCTVANAIERFGVRLRNVGHTRPGLICATGGFPKLLGYAATCRVRSSDPPMTGSEYQERTDWWQAIQRLPQPRIAVIQDLDAGLGPASCVGEVHAAILKAFGCVGVITDGAVRDIPGVIALDFPMMARSVAVSHGYSHAVDYGKPVEIFGLEIRTGDLLYADCHGVVSIPEAIAADLPERAARIREHERRIIDVCQSPGFSPDELVRVLSEKD